MRERRWFNSGHPQTLQLAVMLLYLNGIFGLFGGLFAGGYGLIGIVFVIGMIAGAFGIANSMRWGYRLGLVAAGLRLAYSIFSIVVLGAVLKFAAFRAVGTNVITLIFQVALVVALLHPQSRDYERIWFEGKPIGRRRRGPRPYR